MSTPPDQTDGSPEVDPRFYHEHYHGLETGSYTEQQLVCNPSNMGLHWH
jgi:hypothetical protein